MIRAGRRRQAARELTDRSLQDPVRPPSAEERTKVRCLRTPSPLRLRLRVEPPPLALRRTPSLREGATNSEHNHGGWRDRAIESTDKAIHETEVALAWHP